MDIFLIFMINVIILVFYALIRYCNIVKKLNKTLGDDEIINKYKDL